MNNVSHILITGGTGFIGSRLALQCARDGGVVRVVGQTNTPAEHDNRRELEQQGVQIIEASVTDAEALRRAAAGIDVVYHLAAAQHEANVPDRHFYHVNADGTKNMLEAAVEAGVKRFVHGSTIGVFGISRNGPIHDDSPLDPDNIYGITKLEGERIARRYFDKLPVAIVRIAEAYGPGDRRLLKLFKGIRKGTFFMIGSGGNLHHVVYIDDLIAGLRLAATVDAAAGGTFVLAGPRAVTTDEMVAGIAGALGVRPPRLRVPLWPMMTAAVVMERTLGPLGIQPPLHRRRMNFFVKSFSFSCREARATIGYAPAVDFEEGARYTAEWYVQRGMMETSNRQCRPRYAGP